jgi:murein L,D-transpeptidase YcbB/YkuD
MLRNLIIVLFCCVSAHAQERQQFDLLLQQASRFGLNKEDYLQDPFPDAVIHFFSDIVYGNSKPSLQFEGLKYAPNCYDIRALVTDAMEQQALTQLAQQLEPRSAEYRALKNWVEYYADVLDDPSFKDIRVTSLRTDAGNKLLPARLQQLGMHTGTVEQRIKAAQHFFGIDGTLTLAQLNVPVKERYAALQKALNTVRWLHCLQQQGAVVVVNLPSANMLVYEYGRVTLESKLVVGRRSFPTPAFTSTIHEVIIDPWYIVPKEIALKESLPLIKQNTRYIEENNLQLLNSEGQLVNPYTIDWKKMTPAKFNYTLRQSTGCDNALGRIKFNFQSLPGVYLHDTPWTVLFKMTTRNLSFGCVRVEKATELARLILKNNTTAIDSLSIESSLLNRQPQTIPATVGMPVFVLYNTVWFDAGGAVRFYEDFYSKMSN